jgi:hypothetical protein
MQIILSVITEAVCFTETVVPKYNTIYNSEEQYTNTYRHENLKRKMAVNEKKILNRVRIWSRDLLEKLTSLQLAKKFPAFHGTCIMCYITGERVTFILKCSRISTRRISPLTTEATCLTVTSTPTCSVMKLKWKIEVLTV